MLYALSLADFICFQKMFPGKPVFCFLRLTDNGIADLFEGARIVAETDSFGEFSQ